MPVIKRYPNRKLYDTEAKRYITLNEIAALIRAGEEVIVTDHATDEDLTAVVLTQIIFEQEKAQRGFLPKAVLTNLVRAGGDTLGTLRRGLSLPLDLWRHVDEEIDRRVQTLISKGELAKEEGQKPVSYTHLDVYKRQGRRSSSGTSVPARTLGWLVSP